ncbi:hypothetical protein N431DRAFT_465980 [Stipitochalara longipes BDJ]|nr:hypothetical protein N431DRAFT_465980 [Stipitochalara longipes BDJ]
MAKNKQMDVDGDGNSSHGRESKRTKSKGPSSNRSDTIGHNNGNQRNAESERILDLGAYTNTANTAIRSMLAAHHALDDLAQLYATHVKQIEQINEIQKQHDSLEDQCRDKDEKIRKQGTTIDTICERTRDQEKHLAEEKRSLEEERRELEEDKKKTEKDKATAAKRLKVQGAEQESKLQKAFDKRLAELEKQLRDREKELDRGIQKQEEENKNRLTNLEAENTVLRKKIERLEKEKEEHSTALTKAKDDYDDMKRVKESHKAEARRLETSLKAMENEFAFNSQASDFYTEEFAKISRTIEQISEKYFQELKTEDASNIHQKLIDADIAFASIPLSESRESRDLRIARAQVIISSSLCDIVWQPFSSEKTVQDPDLASVLRDISAELAKANHGSTSGPRAAGIWRALTMRALQSLPPPLPSTESNLPPLSRVDRVAHKVLSILSPLVAPSQEHQLRDDLHALANSAISLWSSAQTGRLQLIVSSSLDIAQRNEWRSLVFDPPSTDDVVSSTHPRIFTLFPRVTALKMPVPADAPASLPGSWPEHNQEPHMIETVIHRGTGLPELSALVVKGKDEEEWRKERIEQELIQNKLAALEKERQELEARGGRNAHSRTSSIVGSASGPTSPTAQWMGRRTVAEQD